MGCTANTVNDNLYDDDVEEQQLSNTVKCGRLDKDECANAGIAKSCRPSKNVFVAPRLMKLNIFI